MDMERRRVTSHDVARRAGVSRATVSMVLNRSKAVVISAETQKRVLEAAAALGYRPNSAARMLVRGDTETIGLVVTDPQVLAVDGFVPQLLYGISQATSESGYRILLEGVEPGAGPHAYAELVEGRRIDGLIVLNPPTDAPQIHALIDQGFPLVLLGSVRHPREHACNFSTRRAIRRSMDHLIGLGHRAIAHIGFSPPGFVATDARLNSYRESLRAHGIEPDDRLVAYGAFSAESGHRAMRELLDRDGNREVGRPTAVLAGNDTIALGAMAALSDAGLSVPDDIALVGFDDLPFAALLRPALTTVRNPGVEQGRQAAQLLIRLLKGETVEQRRIALPTELVIRDSCGAKRRSGP
jgi:LacI family transcriptional regulator